MKSILIKVGVFPLNSETFIINNIILLDQLGYNIKVLCDKKLDFNKSIHKRQLQQLISEDCIIETRKERFSSSKIINWITFCFRNFKYLLDVFRLYRIVNDLTLSFEIIDFPSLGFAHVQLKWSTASKMFRRQSKILCSIAEQT